MDEFDEVMKDAATQMGILCEVPVKNSDDGIHDGLAMMFKRGSCNDKASAVLIAARWMWAHCEKEYHAQKSATAAK